MSRDIVEKFEAQRTQEEILSNEYFVPFLSEKEKKDVAHNFSVLRNLSLGRSIRQSLRVEEQGFSFKPGQTYHFFDGSGRRVYLTGAPEDENRMAFFAYDPGVQPNLKGIEATPNLRVFRRELIMKRSSPGDMGSSEHLYPQVNLKLLFFSGERESFPQEYSVYSVSGQEDAKKIALKHNIYNDCLLGFDYSVGVHYGEKDSYNNFLAQITKGTKEAGGLRVNDFLLHIYSLDNGDLESTLTISV